LRELRLLHKKSRREAGFQKGALRRNTTDACPPHIGR
jgi:hypothetical protein